MSRAAELLARIDELPTDRRAALIERLERDGAAYGVHPLSPGQARLWFLQRWSPTGALYNTQTAVRLRGPLDVELLRGALEQVVGRHAILRTTFLELDGTPYQVVHAEGGFVLEEEDLRARAEDERLEHCRRRVTELIQRPFELERGPLLRATVLRLDDEDVVLLLALHHIVTDGTSMEILQHELHAAYAASARGRSAALPSLPCQYADYAAAMARRWSPERAGEEIEHWRQTLAGAPASLALPTDRERPRRRSYAGAAARHCVPSATLTELRELARTEGCTLFMTLCAAFQWSLAGWSGEEDILVGTPTAGRDRPELEGLIGFFVNTVTVRTDTSGVRTFRGLLRRVRESCLEALAHAELPFERLVEELAPPRDPSRNPIFQVMFAHEQRRAAAADEPALEWESFALDPATAKFDLMLTTAEREHDLSCELEYATELFDGATIESWLSSFGRLLEGVAADPDRPLRELELTSAEARRTVLAWGAGAALPADERSLHERFEQQADARPDAVALKDGDTSFTYAELDQQANRVARRLLAEGVELETPVALCLDRSAELVIAVLAVLKAGGAYLPLDPRWPDARKQLVLRDAGARIVLASDELLSELRGADVEAFTLEAASRDQPATRPQCPVHPDNAAYVLFTSGSTGRPKGVVVTHRNVARLFDATRERFALGSHDVWSFFHSPSFDFSVWEIYGALLHGGRVVCVPWLTSRSPRDFLQLLRRERVTSLSQTPSAFRQLLGALAEAGDDADLPDLRLVVFGGEALEPAILRGWYARFGERVELCNMYGITETTVHVTERRLRPADAERAAGSPIGRGLRDLSVYVLDGGLRPVPVGTPGELYVGGEGVARGYLGRAALTAERFVPDPFAGVPGARMYRSGDRVRWRAGGELEYLGRLDAQVKVRGFRMELGEIEVALRALPGVADALVRAEGTGEERRLVAWVVAAQAAAPLATELRARLRESLPDYMLPAVFVPLERIPLTPNGKLDLGALPRPEDAAALAAPAHVAPRTETERAVAAIWCKLLRLPRVGVDDDFFALGGHSLLAVRALASIKVACGVEFSIRALFEAPTVRGVALEVARSSHTQKPVAPPLTASPDADAISFAQERLWFLHRLEPDSPAYNVPEVLRLRGRLDADALAAAFAALIARHAALRTVFAEHAGIPRAVVQDDRRATLVRNELAHLPAQERIDEARAEVRRFASEPFDLARGPLIRACLLSLGNDDHVLALVLHHVVCDGASLGILARELAELYAARIERREPSLAPLPIAYTDYAAWQRQRHADGAHEDELVYWKEQLAGELPLLELPGASSREHARATTGPGVVPVAVPRELAAALRALAGGERATLFMVVCAAYQWLLARLSGVDDVLVGAPVSGRTMSELEPVVGLFVNTLVLRTDTAAPDTFRELLAAVRDTCLGAYAHAELPFASLVEAVDPQRNLETSPLFQAMLAFENTSRRELELAEIELAPFPFEADTAKVDLTLVVEEDGENLQAHFKFPGQRFPQALVEGWGRAFETLLGAVAAAPDQRLRSVSLVSDDERRALLELARPVGTAAPRTTLVNLIEGSVARAAETPALVRAERSISYAELARRANALASRLAKAGLGPESRVALYFEDGPSFVIACLGVLRAGAAYVPFDPAWPAARTALLARDSGATIWVTEEALRERAPAAVKVWTLDERGHDERPAVEFGPGNAAYVIYTSGSTGRPKGVVVEHGAIASYVDWVRSQCCEGASEVRTLVHTSLAYDLAHTALFGVLAAGGTVEFASESAKDAPIVPRAKERPYTFLKLTPSHLRLLESEHGPGELHRLADLFVVGGEQLDAALLAPLVARSPVPRVINHYGPTEAVVGACFHVWDNASTHGPVPIGRPFAGARAYVLDTELQPVPRGFEGELFIGGERLARGYLDQPARTAERFLPDSLATTPGARMYRTGDRVVVDADGALVFRGRVDGQIKLRGVRIEPGEIETALSALESVEQAVVELREIGGDERLVAYYVPSTSSSPEVAELREHLRAILPAAHVPAHFVALEELPLTPNGKLDRRRLPQPSPGVDATRERRPPRDAVEKTLARIWKDVLGLREVGLDDDFFELGGHSLLAVQIAARAREALRRDVPLRSIFEAPTLEELARLLRDGPRTSLPARSRIEPADRSAPLPLSFAQARVWFLEQLEAGSAAYHMPSAWRVRGPLDADALDRALHLLIERQESLRTGFVSRRGEPRLRILERAPETLLERLDLSALAPATRIERVRDLARAEARRPFDLAHAPLLRCTLVRLAEDDHALFVTMHHIVSDGWSRGIFLEELAVLYRALQSGAPAALAPLSVQYADYAAWQHQPAARLRIVEQLTYWRRQLGGELPVLALPTDRPRRADADHRGAVVRQTLGAETTAALRRFARDERATLFMALLAAYQVLLGRLARQDDVLVGAPVSGRDAPELEPLIGFFIDTIVFRTDLSSGPTFRELVRRVRRVALEAFEHQEVPFERIVEALAPERDLGHNPVFQAFFNLFEGVGAEAEAIDLQGSSFEALDPSEPWSKFDLTLYAYPTDDGGLQLDWVYAPALFDRQRIEIVADQLRSLLTSALAAPDRPLHEISLATPSTAQLLPSPAPIPAPSPSTMPVAAFVEWAGRAPDASALHDGTSWSYAELAQASAALAARVTELTRPGDVVAVCLERSAALVATLLGVMRSGRVLLVLDPEYPQEARCERARLAGAQLWVGDDAEASSWTVLPLRGRTPAAITSELGAPSSWCDPEIDPSDATYVVFTSGTTRNPKGVVGSHAPLAHFLKRYREHQRFGPGDRFAMLSGLGHDPLLRDVLAPLTSGATLCIPPAPLLEDAERLVAWLRTERIGVIHSTPSRLRSMKGVGESLTDLRIALLGGETLRVGDLRSLARLAPHARLVNAYGATETPQVVAWFEPTPGFADELPDEALVPIGHPVGEAQLLIQTARGGLAGIGELGELCVRSPHLALGYLESTAPEESGFADDPFGDGPRVRLYRTGDLASYRHDGTVALAGRVDRQVQLHGIRVEPAEIESWLEEHPSVARCAVVARAGSPGELTLVAYVVARATASAPEPGALRDWLRARLPLGKVPSRFIVLDELPLTPNGKLDYARLPEPTADDPHTTAPATWTEEWLADVWKDLLAVTAVTRSSSFFELGGHSLLATQLVSEVRRTQDVELPLRVVFERPGLRELARAIDDLRRKTTDPGLPPIARRGARKYAPSFAQSRLWFLQRLEPTSAAYNMAYALRVSGPIDEEALRATLCDLLERHEVLRTALREEDGEPTAVVEPTPAAPLIVRDLSTLAAQDRLEAARELAREEASTPFDLSLAPILRCQLVRLSAVDSVLLLTLHHVGSDGWSLGVLARELSALYGAHVRGTEPRLAPLALQYGDYAEWQHEGWTEERLERELDFWRAELAGAPAALDLPLDRPRKARRSERGERRTLDLDPELAGRLRELAARENASLFMVVLAAYQAWLSHVTDQDDVVVGTPVAGRDRPELEPLIGFFVNTLALRGDLSGSPTFREAIRRARRTCLRAYDHATLPFERLVAELAQERDLSRNPIFETVMVLANEQRDALELADASWRPLDVDRNVTKFDLALTVAPGEEAFGIQLEYATELFDGATIESWLSSFGRLLEGVAADPDRPLRELELTSAEARRTVLAWGAGAALPADERSLHERFEQQADARPDAVALKDGDTSFTYAELDQQANRVARRLLAEGVELETPVALCLDRSAELVIAVLAVLKAGGAYLPLDPRWPDARKQLVLRDAGARIVLASDELLSELRGADVEAFTLEAASRDQPATRPQCPVHPDNAAYVLFTSGSTGRPKGVVVTHRNVARLFDATRERFALGSHDVWSFFHSPSFDFSVWEIYGALLHGGRVVCVPWLTSRSPRDFLQLLRRERVTSLSQTPSAFRQLLGALAEAGDDADLPDLRLVVFGGEALEPAILRGWYARFGERVELCNMYGITETTVHVTERRLRPADAERAAGSPIGRGLRDLSVYVLDGGLRPVPVGTPGELYVGGEGVARGYLGRAALTAERFVPDPFAGVPGARMYRSGDRVRWRAGGELEYLGRLDAQVKVRGFRMELGEIEVALRALPGVADALVRAEGTGEERRLVAWVVAAQAAAPLATELRARLRESLPDYMLPAVFVPLERIPLTPNGKLDLGALPRPEDAAALAAPAHVAPRTETERAVAAIWCKLLRLPRVGVDDDFFALGGHSLLAVRLFARLHAELGSRIALATLFEAPTLADLCRRLDDVAPTLRSSSPLVLLQRGESGPPVFLLHPAGGGVACYRPLAQRLNGRTCYALRSLGLDPGEEPLESLEAMAALYLDSILSVQPEGPRTLIGWSLGGVVAFELAQRFVAAGEPPPHLVLLDSLVPPPPAEEGPDPRTILRELLADAPQSFSVETLLALDEAAQARALHEAARAAGTIHPDVDLAIFAAGYRTHKRNLEALRSYVPHPYSGPVTLVRAEQVGPERGLYPHAADPTLGWGSLAKLPVDILPIEGRHATLVFPPTVDELAKLLEPLLRGASPSHSGARPTEVQASRDPDPR